MEVGLLGKAVYSKCTYVGMFDLNANIWLSQLALLKQSVVQHIFSSTVLRLQVYFLGLFILRNN